MKNLSTTSIILLAFILLWPLNGAAQTAPATTVPAKQVQADIAAAPEYKVAPAQTTYPMLRLSPDKPQIIKLDSDARSVLVGNPAHLNVILDNTRTVVLVPRDPGATYFTVIGRDGDVIMERYVIVAGPANKYIRIRRTCPPGSTTTCTATSVYYCPDLCYETEIMSSTEGQSAAPPPALPSGSPGASPGTGPVITNPVATPAPVK